MVCLLLLGTEQGLGIFQPSEMAKLFLILIGATTGMHINELRNYDSKYLTLNPFQLVWPFISAIVLFSSIALFVFLSVKDISPIVISSVFFVCSFWKNAPHPQAGRFTISESIIKRIIYVFVMLLAVVIVLIYNYPDYISDFMHQKYRILVWANPGLYPHSGEQVIRSMTICSIAGCFGAADSWFGFNNIAMDVPMIQNDFIGAFIIYKFGIIFTLLIILIQSAYVSALLLSSKAIESIGSANFEKRRIEKIFSLIIFGFVCMLIIQLLISWSNVFGLFPVMGQPMTWFSQANSHLLFFALPSAAFTLIVNSITEKNYWRYL